MLKQSRERHCFYVLNWNLHCHTSVWKQRWQQAMGIKFAVECCFEINFTDPLLWHFITECNQICSPCAFQEFVSGLSLSFEISFSLGWFVIDSCLFTCTAASTHFVNCRQPGDDNKMLVCDTCDKGYHTFCLQPAMTTIPKNGWKCKVSYSMQCAAL